MCKECKFLCFVSDYSVTTMSPIVALDSIDDSEGYVFLLGRAELEQVNSECVVTDRGRLVNHIK